MRNAIKAWNKNERAHADMLLRYQCKVCGSFSRLFVQCQPCLLKFIKANGVGERKQPEHF